MENLKTWAATLIVFSVIILLYRMLFPKGNIQKAGETVIALLMVFLMIKPIFSLLSKENGGIDGFADYDLFTKSEDTQENKVLEDTIQNQLAAAGISVESVSVDASLDAENYLVIRSVEITAPDSANEQAIYDCLQTAYQIPKEIISIRKE